MAIDSPLPRDPPSWFHYPAQLQNSLASVSGAAGGRPAQAATVCDAGYLHCVVVVVRSDPGSAAVRPTVTTAAHRLPPPAHRPPLQGPQESR